MGALDESSSATPAPGLSADVSIDSELRWSVTKAGGSGIGTSKIVFIAMGAMGVPDAFAYWTPTTKFAVVAPLSTRPTAKTSCVSDHVPGPQVGSDSLN